jgi:hypothetical protein
VFPVVVSHIYYVLYVSAASWSTTRVHATFSEIIINMSELKVYVMVMVGYSAAGRSTPQQQQEEQSTNGRKAKGKGKRPRTQTSRPEEVESPRILSLARLRVPYGKFYREFSEKGFTEKLVILGVSTLRAAKDPAAPPPPAIAHVELYCCSFVAQPKSLLTYFNSIFKQHNVGGRRQR